MDTKDTKDTKIINMYGDKYEIYEVGKPLEPGITNYPEGSMADFSKMGLTIVIKARNLTEKEIDHVRNGVFQIALVRIREVIFINAKFGKLNWMEMPYHVALSQIRWVGNGGGNGGDENNKIPLGDLEDIDIVEPPAGFGYQLIVCLVEASTGIIKGMRQIGLSIEFSKELRDAILRQIKSGAFMNGGKFHDKIYNDFINRVWEQFGPEEMIWSADKIYILDDGKWKWTWTQKRR